VAEAEATVQLAQRIVVLAKRAMLAVMALAVVAAGVSLWLARRRARAGLLLLMAAVAATVVVRALGAAVVERVPTLAVQPGARAAVGAVVGSLVEGLITLSSIVALIGALVAIAVWATGAGTTRRSVAAVVGDHREAVAGIAYAAALAVILVGGFGAAQFLIAVGLGLAGGLILRRSTAAT
jgi:hypothetical protein